jgi:hypothetical protein
LLSGKGENVIHSYPSVYQVGHKAIQNLFDGKVFVQEKVDGSQFSFGLVDGTLQARSKGQQLIIDAPGGMFQRAVDTIKALPLHPEWVYRSEYLQKPKHNTLVYSRTPKQNLILYDISTGQEEYAPYSAVCAEAERIGLEVVPQFYEGEVKALVFFKSLLETESILGGTKIEGVVVKNYAQFTGEKKVAMGKYVREDFKEENAKDFRARNPTGNDITQELILRYKTDARWRKAIQHLNEQGKLEGAPRDIALLMREVPDDIFKECEEEIRDILFKHFWPNVRRGVTSGLPEWYKEQLAGSAFATPQNEE